MKTILSGMCFVVCVILMSCSGGAQTVEAKTQSMGSTKTPKEVAIKAPVEEVKKVLSPMESIKDLDRQVEAYHVGQGLTPEQLAENKALKKRMVRGTFDIRELSKQALAKHWETISEAERNQVVDLLTRLLEKRALFSKEKLSGDSKYYQMVYSSEKIDPENENLATVVSKMKIPKRKIDLNLTYKLLKKNDVWKIFDMIVDDASLVSNYRFQFDRIIQKGGFADLIAKMEKKLESIQ